MKRIDYIRTMRVEEIAKAIRGIENIELDDYCKSTCDYASTMEDEPLEKECIECCIRWLEEEVKCTDSK